jgi:polyisoprenoid-binding protein YceI
MNEHLRKALKANDNPQLSFALESYATEVDGSIRLIGQLTMAGRALPVEFSGTVTEKEGGLVRVEASRQIRMTDWGIKPPTLFVGTLRVHDPVTIGVDVLLKR